MSPTPLSEWADANGVPRRTAYNRAGNGTLGVPFRRTITGRILVLDDDLDGDEHAGPSEHPFAQAYAEALGLPFADRAAAGDYSDVLEAWGTSLYDAVASDLRPVVLQLAMAAAARCRKKDVPARFSDWIGRAELAEWYLATGMPEAAAMVRSQPAITDPGTFRMYWPGSVQVHEWRNELDALVSRLAREAGAASRRGDHGAAEYLAENSILGAGRIKIAAYRERLHWAIGTIADEMPAGSPLPDKGDLWDLRAFYLEPMWAYARPAVRQMAEVACELAGWDPGTPAPPASHPLMEFGYAACSHAAWTAVTPLEHAALLREMRAFRRIAYGQPLDD
jgi:hypothetical protein